MRKPLTWTLAPPPADGAATARCTRSAGAPCSTPGGGVGGGCICCSTEPASGRGGRGGGVGAGGVCAAARAGGQCEQRRDPSRRKRRTRAPDGVCLHVKSSRGVSARPRLPISTDLTKPTWLCQAHKVRIAPCSAPRPRAAPAGAPGATTARLVLGAGEHPQLAERHLALLRRLADQAGELDAREVGRAELLEAEQLGMQRDHVGAAGARLARRQHVQQLLEHLRRRQAAQRRDVGRVPGRLQAQEAAARGVEHLLAVERRRESRSRRSAARSLRGARRRAANTARACCRRQIQNALQTSAKATTIAAMPAAPGRRAARRRARSRARPEPEPGREAAERRARRRRQRPPASCRTAGAGRRRPRGPGASGGRRGRAVQHLIPTCSATTPALRLCTSTWPKPAVFIIAFSVAWSGCMRIDSAR